jgi:hypothetical protein
LDRVILIGAGPLRSRVAPAWAGGAVILSAIPGPVAQLADAKAIDLLSGAILLVGLAVATRLVGAMSDSGLGSR